MVVSGNGWLACKNRYQKSYWKSNYNPNRTSNPNNWYRSSVKQLTYQIRLIGRDILWAINTISLALWQDIIASLSYPPLEGDEIWDPGFLGDSEMWQRAETQELRLQHFESRWKRNSQNTLASFTKYQKRTNHQFRSEVWYLWIAITQMFNGEWQFLEILKINLVKVSDGLARATNIQTSKGKTNRLITRLHPLEFTY